MPSQTKHLKCNNYPYQSIDSGLFYKKVINKLKELGAQVEEVKINWNKKELEDTCYNYYAHLFANVVAELIPQYEEELTLHVLLKQEQCWLFLAKIKMILFMKE